MVDRENREDWRRERSLLALGKAVRGDEAADASAVSIGDRVDPSWREDAATRHRIARSQREARSNPAPTSPPEPPQFQADGEPVSAASAREEPVSGRRQQHAAYELRSFHEQRPDRDDDDGQEWKPLIDPLQVVRGISRSKLLIVSTTILGTVLGVAVAVSTPKKYEATTQMVIEPGDLKLSDNDLTQPVGQPDAALAVVETRIKMVTSGKVLDKVVADLNLVDDPEFNGQGSGGLGVLSLIRSILSRQDGPGGGGEVRRQALAVGNLAKSLSVERSGKSFVVSISATTQSADKSAKIANTTRDVFQQEAAQYQFGMAGRATDQLTAKLDDLRKNVETAERKVEDFRATHDLVDAQGHLISDDQMLKLNEQLSVTRARTLELNARAASARSLDVNSVINGTLPEEINSNTMSELRAQYAVLKQEADRAAVRLGPRHPEYQALNAQLDGSRERIAGELRRIASSLQVDLKRSVQLEQDLASRLAQAKVQSGDVNSDLVSLRELERDATAKRSVYEQYLLRAKETGEQQNINTTNINLMTPAQPPLEPNGPSRAVIAMAGLLLGLASGIGVGAMRGAFASLRGAANSRSRGRMDERPPPVEDKVYRAPLPVAPPPAAPPVLPTAAAPARSPGLFDGLFSAMRKAAPGSGTSGEPVETYRAQPAAEYTRPVQEPVGYRQPDFRNEVPHANSPAQQPGYAQPRQPADYAYSQAQPMPAASGPWSSPQPAGAAPEDQQAQIDDIRASLREFREAVRELTESRSHRRYF
ncbi:succinoglycan biosynthesis protein ExoP [Mesorhizobium sp. LSJC268A00]|uniref:GumC family protein n=1 Tax=unclassified Mesorhizobium TaxID=325217 RepID=UPI0003CE5BCF|nr:MULTISPECIES: GumC family protein [unclassified Mesorhizobium]ESX04489.1 succinoglycan biosynthesis protein ExoP [Mesorhizobium sp. LSJC268A00]ESX09559.1 succinoglycan biosynthesis protein ExoP [Mesorhizobium sp. LSJC265A00]ESX56826.1 succinoglycan biosynthesis protein ExoP [Mesorhizobium sp. LSHC422A00]ESY06557.1 succinoglycan biosynthesis protein ExoP [Mesorhizobium sp. LNJC399B00]ESY31469.1 succinoglycan biosynthesis protein ExoP [Mesorhizobium sp. LNJC391B00]